MTRIHKSHDGELQLQARRNTPKALIDAIPQYISRDMPQQHADFFAGLPYLPLATLDAQGRPWVSLLVTASPLDPALGITPGGGNTLDVLAQSSPHDPLARALGQMPVGAGLFAGVGVDFTNRRRNKIAGSIESADVDSTGKLRLRLRSDQHLGNCPKYITLRGLSHTRRNATRAHDSFATGTEHLPQDAKAVINRASTVFLATKHINSADSAQSDMGVNHRGGAPGFTRLYEGNHAGRAATYLVLPDHSGNRFYQSLGNIEADPKVGLVFPDFETGDVLYITGEAENLMGQAAEALMPRVNLLTRIRVTGAVFVKQGLNLALTSAEQLSPYNPPLRYLRQELAQMGHAIPEEDAASAVTATLLSTRTLSQSIRTFHFKLSAPISPPLPGGFGVFDFSGLLDTGYSHMNEANPQLVNEDYLRTWTLSSAPPFDAETNSFRPTDEVSITVKRKPGGLMSNLLHDNAHRLIAQKLPVAFKGTGTGFSCFSGLSTGGLETLPPKMLWIAGGVGLTPFMSMWSGLLSAAQARPQSLRTDIVLLYAGRGDDIDLLTHFAPQGGALPEGLSLQTMAFQSSEQPQTQGTPMPGLHNRRMQIADFQSLPDLHSREVYLCGPDPLMDWSEAALTELGLPESRLHREGFAF
ncbi:pyridoxamine 5'-phosphate oxidase family protein [Alphaproteobacteria bacterium KMM 3653]|uniref:Pyridoxamine 5'-phosphate oxidase family protein n=1 Tax=Harenicola maris TaxID=2841044 RepID=A0AAP2CQJ4_9RHOB|nr:pyridoxamine 5'-phosphate oxidase family protein [Harenicola maris]